MGVSEFAPVVDWSRLNCPHPCPLLARGMGANLSACCGDSYSLSLWERAGVRAPRSRFQGYVLNLPTLTLTLSRQREREKEAGFCKLALMPGRGGSKPLESEPELDIS